ncbi:39S ribosomal protein L38, mitochondrial-like [Paramacrobiotus metropolitanus]|uniref:39S ribosomal protein L38, mitochondrial-like n=1 Tax=Paramacrobiotus metropolitanus TaxID=2943436 RepID=UPI0024463A6B|nr:39S ribosomal protein L38, mitochondrial-like [Paramacrobiotus metropolitanus]
MNTSLRLSGFLRGSVFRYPESLLKSQTRQINQRPRQRLERTGLFPGFPRIWASRFQLVGFKDSPDILPSLEQRLAAENPYDEEVERLINIGMPLDYGSERQKKTEKDYRIKLREVRRNPALEKAARHRTLKADLSKVLDEWETEAGPEQISGAAMHYGVFEDLFGAAYFIPYVPIRPGFHTDDYYTPVHRGNHILPADAMKVPDFVYAAPDDTLWTLTMVNLDGNLQDSEAEYLHWMVSNIPGGDVAKGETIVDYLQPIPVRGTGFHRYAFLLFQQKDRMDFRALKTSELRPTLSARIFRMKEFYRARQDDLMPAGLAFFLSEWDESVTDCFHSILDIAEPAFEYEPPPPDLEPQAKYPPDDIPFNVYLDRYRDKKEIAEEVVKKRLSRISPFGPEPARLKWPLAQKFLYSNLSGIPSWKRLEMRKELLGVGRYKLLYDPLAKWG